MQRIEEIILIDPTSLTVENQAILAEFLRENKQDYYSEDEEYHQGDITFKLKYALCARDRKPAEERKNENKIRIEGDRYEVLGDRILGQGNSGFVVTVKGTLILKNDNIFEYKNSNQQSHSQRVVKIYSSEKILDAMEDFTNGTKGRLHPKKPVFVHKNNQIFLFMRRAKGVRFSTYVSSINSTNNICQTIMLIKALITAYIKQVLTPNLLHRDLRIQNLILDVSTPMHPRIKIIDFASSKSRSETTEDNQQACFEIYQLITVFVDRIWEHCPEIEFPPGELEMINKLFDVLEKMKLQYRSQRDLPESKREWKDQSHLLIELLHLLDLTEEHFQAFFYERAIEALKSKNILEECQSFLDAHKEYAEAISEHPEHVLSCLNGQNRSTIADFDFPNVLTKKSIKDSLPSLNSFHRK